MCGCKSYLVTLLLFFGLANHAVAERVDVGNFSKSDLLGWEKHDFKGETNYELSNADDQTVLRASSNNSASGLIKQVRIDLDVTPYLNWRWRIKQPLYRLAEDLKEGDDFAARVYVVIDGGIFFWRTMALNYVWSSKKPINTLWDNPFTGNAKMLALQSGEQKAGQWISEKRNIKADLEMAFGRKFRLIDAVAIMTDTDNSGQQATAYYGDIYFTAD